MLDASFVKSIDDLAVKASKPIFTPVPGDDRQVFVARPDGTSEFVETPKHMVAKIDRVESVFAMAAEWRAENPSVGEDDIRGPKMFLSPEKLVAVSDIDDRRERAVCELKLTQHAAHLKSPQPATQESFLNMLRFAFAERVDKNVIEKVKAIRFKKTEEGTQGVGHQAANASISREVQIESLAGGSIPDSIPVPVRPFVCFDFEATVTCAVVIDLERKTFRLAPIAEELDELFVAALDKIAALRTAAHPPLYFGKVNTGRTSDDES